MKSREICKYIIYIVVSLLFMGCSLSEKEKNIVEDHLPDLEDIQKENDNEPPVEIIDPIKEQIKEMSIEEKIGQMIIVGIEGYTLDEKSRKLIEEEGVGGIIIFGKNVESPSQLLSLVNSLKEANSKNKNPLFVSVDEEGGRVSRMPKEVKKLSTNEEIGLLNNKELSYKIGAILAEELNIFGFNMNFAPVLDINSNPNNPVIGDRAFGVEPYIVSDLGIQTMKGIQSGGIISVIKHFPGHGDTSVDSHIGLPAIEHDIERLNSFELVPFRKAIEDGADTVMVAHILMSGIDSESPASLSKTIITGILRDQLEFDGVVISDDLTMGAIIENYDLGEAAIKAIDAGSDIVLVAHGFENGIAVINAMKEAIISGRITEERLDESIYRILRQKQKYRITDNRIENINVEDINNRIDEIMMNYY
ncbi:MAG: beta-N-acetylhexosaminidase [Tissierellales bacterium]